MKYTSTVVKLAIKADAAVKDLIDGMAYNDVKEKYGSIEFGLALGRLNKRRILKETRKLAVKNGRCA